MMIAETIRTITTLISSHPHWIGFAVFAATTLESMAFIGSFFPGMSIVIALSGIAASLGANVGMLVLWCTLGAILGDGVSYSLGHRFGDRLKSTWPFRTRLEILEKGTEFFQRNGGKSIFIGRFLPFTRAVVPIAAGMLGMKPLRFYVANIFSAIAWALMNVLPAAGMGLAFTVINQASSRIAVMLALFVGIFLLALLAAQGTVRIVLPRLDSALTKSFEMLKRGPKWATALLALVLGASPRSVTASVAWVAMITGLVLSFAKIFEDVATNDPLVRMDVALSSLVKGLRNPIGDQFMVVLTSIGDTTVVLSGCVALVGGLLILRAWRLSGMAAFVLVSTIAFVPLLKWTLHKPRPFVLYSGADTFSFPSGHAALTAVLWGLTAVVAAHNLPRKARATIWALAFTVSISVGLSRVYLSAHWPSDVMGGLLFGWLMTSLFGMFEARTRERITRPGLLGLTVSTVALAVWGLHATFSFEENLARYQPRSQVIAVTLADWIEGEWRRMPPARIDLKGEYEESLIFQAVVSPAEIEKSFRKAGWLRAPVMNWRQATQFFGGKRDLTSLSPLPLLHNGVPPLLMMATMSLGNGKRDVFRLWRTDFEFGDLPERPALLVGSVTQEHVWHPFDGINVLRDNPAPDDTVQAIIRFMGSNPAFCMTPVSFDPDNAGRWLIVSRNMPGCHPESTTPESTPNENH